MNLETLVKPELWNAIEHSYKSGNYSHAIQDAMAFVTEVLRDKSGLDGDGDKLVTRALSFSDRKPPKLKINSLQTQTERDIQRGLMLVLQGMYALVRNPRHHERIEDDRKTCDTIVLFIDFLLDFLGASFQSYTVQDFLSLVTDAHFVLDQEYVSAIVDKIPRRKMGDTLIAVYKQVNWKQANNFEMVIKEILSRISEPETRDLLAVIADDLMKVRTGGEVALIIKILPPELWPSIEKTARLRAEKILLDELREAWYIPDTENVNRPAATWIPTIAPFFSRRDNLRKVLIQKMYERDFDHHNFVARYFMDGAILPKIFGNKEEAAEFAEAIAHTLKSGNEFVKEALIEEIFSFPAELVEIIAEKLKDLTDPEHPEYYLPDGRPLLGKFESRANPASEDEIPS